MGSLFKNRWFKTFAFLLIGGAGGFAYYYFIGCNGGTCPISSNPYISTTYGAVMGLLLSFNNREKSGRKYIK